MTSTLESAAVVGIIIASAVGTFILVVLTICCCHKHRSTIGNAIRQLQQPTSMTTRQHTCQTISTSQPVVHGALHQWAYNSPPEVGGQSYPPYMIDSKGPGGSGGFMEVAPLEPTAPPMDILTHLYPGH
ncbi:hypothetical protein CHS0354_038386 [Potamilus streckersoni]|uniref:Uncharacterized protein n=1 Tax=Potamilus streckersoni TaxID=2493646 RepID=A0AAE0VQU9_9BIVA|nr:hypothetical protein CHS0354_038386 [Potamilus streckersoni]